MSKEYKVEIQKRIENTYPKIGQKKNIVYCPTFRKDENKMLLEIEKIVKKIDYDKYNLIIKLHPLSKIEIKDERVIYDKQFSSFDMLFIADSIISDYSCIIYEAAILKIPLYFWAFDLEEYLNTRGLTFDYQKEVPGIISENIDEILNAIKSEVYDYNKLEEFKRKYVINIKECTKKIVDFISEEIIPKTEKDERKENI